VSREYFVRRWLSPIRENEMWQTFFGRVRRACFGVTFDATGSPVQAIDRYLTDEELEIMVWFREFPPALWKVEMCDLVESLRLKIRTVVEDQTSVFPSTMFRYENNKEAVSLN
jgi:hypothetical protein